MSSRAYSASGLLFIALLGCAAPEPAGGSGDVLAGPAAPQPAARSWRPPAPAAAAPAAAAVRPVGVAGAGGVAWQRPGTQLPGLFFEAEPSLRRVVQTLAEQGGFDAVVHREAEEAVEDAGIVFDLDRARPIAVRDALDLVVELTDGLVAWTVRDGVVLVTTPERARSEPRLAIFGVGDLVRGTAIYAPPDIGRVHPSGYRREGEFGIVDYSPGLSEDTLIELIRTTVAPGTWDLPGNSIEIHDGKLIVRHD